VLESTNSLTELSRCGTTCQAATWH